MGFKKAWPLVLACLLATSGCGVVIGNHPFDSLPPSSGKLDKKPNVLILRGQAPEVCGEAHKSVNLVYFVHLRWMPFQTLWVETPTGDVELFGKEFTIKVKVKVTPGYMTYAHTKFHTEKQAFELTTIVMACSGVSAERQ